MKAKGNKKRKQKSRAHKKCIIVTSEQVQAVKETIATSGQAVFLGATITAVSLFSSGCATFCKMDDIIIQAEHAASPQELAELLEKCDNYYSVKEAIADNPKTSINLLVKLADDKDIYYADKYDSASASSRVLDVLGALAANPKTPAESLRKIEKRAANQYWMWSEKKDAVKRAVACHPNTLPDVLTKLEKDTDSIVRDCAIASNPKTPIYVLTSLADDKEYSIRAAVARNPSTPINVLEKLAEDNYGWVRYGIIYNPNPNISNLRNKVKKYCSLNCTARCTASVTAYCTGCTGGCTYGCISCTTGGCTGCTFCTSCTGICTDCTRCTYMPRY